MIPSIVVLLAVLLAVASLRGDGARARYIARRLSRKLPDSACPPATVIVPVKDGEEGLAGNLASLAALDYPDYELIVVAREERDIPEGVTPPSARVVIAGEGDPNTGEKINNLIAAVDAARDSSRIFAFADSDGQVSPAWLRALALPLGEPGAGVATGYRWHVPLAGGIWPLMRSVWNSVIAGGFHGGNNNFCWGGAMAITRENFDRADVRRWWRGAISDDFKMSEAIRAAGLSIAFAPGAMVASTDSTSAREFLGWIKRQMVITRVYQPRLWWLGFVAHLIYCAAMLDCLWSWRAGGLAWLAAILIPGMWKGRCRARWASAALPDHRDWFRRHCWIYTWLVPLGTWVWLYSFIASARTNIIRWRGVHYRITRTAAERVFDGRAR